MFKAHLRAGAGASLHLQRLVESACGLGDPVVLPCRPVKGDWIELDGIDARVTRVVLPAAPDGEAAPPPTVTVTNSED